MKKKERDYIRELSKKQLEAASLPIMEERRKKWTKLNNGEVSEPLVGVEYNGLADEIFPDCQCESPLARELEAQIRRNIIYHECVNDDRVIPAYVSVPVYNNMIPFNHHTEYTYAHLPGGGSSMGYSWKYRIEDLERDFHVLEKSVFTVDPGLKKSLRWKAEAEEIIGDILPARITFPSFYFCLAGVMCSLMGMENMMLAIYDYPELFHRAMSALTNDYMEYMDAIEENGAILPNNDNSPLNQGSWGFTESLPPAGEIKGKTGFGHVWGHTNSQETVDMGVEMYDEFFFSYMEKLTERFGLLSYGCCEPVDGIWARCLSRLSNLRKLSVSAWCDEEYIGECIRGKKIVYHRKPSAIYISVDPVFDEEAFGAHIAKTIKAAAGCPLEITFREELTLRNEPWRLRRAVEIVREQYVRYWKH